MKALRILLLTSAGIIGANAAVAQEPVKVVATIKPIYSLLTAITAGTDTQDTLLVKGAGSPHTYAMSPSDATALQNANIVFWVGPSLEHFLEKPLAALGGDADVITLADATGVKKLAERDSGTFEADADGDDHDHADGGEEHFDPHTWLDPINAKAFGHEMAQTLAAADPDNAAIYTANAAKLDARLDELQTSIQSELSQYQSKPYVVFHDAYHYYTNRFGDDAVGSITVNPEAPPSAARIREIQNKLAGLETSCVFSEPEFPPKVVQTVTEGTNTYIGVLDPLGAALTDGPDLYFELLNNLTNNLTACFKSK